jgi:hypothetical protein
MLSCNSTSASICGLALSWKYNPQALGASQLISGVKKNKVPAITDPITLCKSKLLIIFSLKDTLCKGKLVNACGLGGLCKAHSNPGEVLSLRILK